MVMATHDVKDTKEGSRSGRLLARLTARARGPPTPVRVAEGFA
jgi:hypothetical protein